MKRFVQNLETRGLAYERRTYGRGFIGIKVETPETQDQWSAQ